MDEAWADVSVDAERTLVYGPRLGRLYLLSQREIDDRHLQWVIGLWGRTRVEAIQDPAARVVHDVFDLQEAATQVRRHRKLQLLYFVFRSLRGLLPLRLAARLVRRFAAISRTLKKSALTHSEIGRLVYAVERYASAPDCYPRALLTAYLALAAGARRTRSHAQDACLVQR
jgi:integrase